MVAANAHRETAKRDAAISGQERTVRAPQDYSARYKPPRLTSEVTVPSIRGDANQQGARVHRALRVAVDSLQEVLESKKLSGLP
jgi:hypothetical protein